MRQTFIRINSIWLILDTQRIYLTHPRGDARFQINVRQFRFSELFLRSLYATLLPLSQSSQTRKALAWIVSAGFKPPEVTNTLESMMNRLRTSSFVATNARTFSATIPTDGQIDSSTRGPGLGRGFLLRISPHGRTGRYHRLALGAPHIPPAPLVLLCH